MCEFCEAGEPIRVHCKECDTSARVMWERGKWRLAFEAETYDVRVEMKFDADYCPMCGSRLDGKDE